MANKPRAKPGRRSDRTDPVLKLKSIFFLSIQSKKMPIVCATVYILLAMTIGILVVYFTAPRPSRNCELSFKRRMKSSLISSSQPRSVAVGDLNNDQQIDFVVANSGTNNIGVFISQDNGTFANQVTYFTGTESHPRSLAISDFNNDTYLDIVVANYETNNIGLFLGYGNGTFHEQKIISLGASHPLFVSTGDFNKDNRMDIATVNNGTNTISILLGYGNGSFQEQTNYSTGFDSLPSSLAITDFNNDTYLDMVVANSGTDNIGIFLNYGNGTYTDQQLYTTILNSKPTSVAIGDLNSDNILDIIVANNGSGSVGIFFGHGNGTFLPQVLYKVGRNANPQYVTVSDMNTDNALDIVVIDSTHDQVHILPGYGNGSFETIVTYDGVFGSMPVWIAVDDFNNNNQSDVIVVNYGTNNVVALMDYFSKPSVRQVNYPVGRPIDIGPVTVSDFNNDSIHDIVAAHGNKISILIGLGDSTFAEPKTYTLDDALEAQYVCTGDLNNDNRTDIIIADISSHRVVVALGYGNGSFSNITSYSTGPGSQPYWVALGDLNDDNVLDIVSANHVNYNMSIFLGYGNGTFVPMMSYSTADNSGLTSVAIGDTNNDKHLDIVILDQNNRVFTFLGQGNATFILITTTYSATHSNSFSFFLADINQDNQLDIAVANTFEYNIGISLGYGNGTFAPQIKYSTGPGSVPCYVIVSDCNNDNKSDIVATNYGTNEVVILYGYGNGSFELSRKYSTGFSSRPFGIVAADLDSDTQLEFVVGLSGTGDIAILTEYYAAEFQNKVVYPTGLAPQPTSVATADFNNDSRLDIVVANSGRDSLDIFLASNNGTYDTDMKYFIGTDYHPQYIMTSDINNDNYIDIVSTNSKNNSISVIMGYGNGSFAKQIIYATGGDSSPYNSVAGDLNNDNRLDLVIANSGTDSIGILYGYEYRSFHSLQNYSITNGTAPWGIIVNDFNNDNILDIVAAMHYGDTWCILLGYGNGSFTAPKIYPLGLYARGAWGINAGDFNNDNLLDIVIANYWSYNIGVYLGYGNGSFSTVILCSTSNGSKPISVAVGDLNNDNRLDIVVAMIEPDNIEIFLGSGNGSFVPMISYSTGQKYWTYSVTVADFNNDGWLDVAVTNYDASDVGVRLGYANGIFQNQVNFSVGYNSFPMWIVAGHFNGDAHLDIATANSGGNNVGILLGHGNGTFAPLKTYSTGDGSAPYSVSVGDFNNDNISDIAVASYGNNNIVVLFGLEDGSFLLGTPHATGSGSLPRALAIGNFGEDRRLGIAVANVGSNSIRIFLADDIQPFGAVTQHTTGEKSRPHAVALGDFNNDSWIDIVVANYGTDSVSILLGRSGGNFSDSQPYSMGNGSAPYSVAVAHFNNDTYLDIVVSNSGTDDIVILFGDGTGKFTTGDTYSTGIRSRPYTVTARDFNNDNILDIAVANSGTNSILILYGHGNGTFENDTLYPFGYGYQPYSIAVGDLNDDGRMDMAIACYGTDHVETLVKMC